MPRTEAEVMTRRITTTYRIATPEHIAAGRGWYREAYNVAASLWPQHPDTAAGVIAALSPRCQWVTNIEWSRQVINAVLTDRPCPRVSTFRFADHAWKIANGADPLTVLNGPKTRAFYRNITGDTDAVTVDVWAVLVATGSKDAPTSPKRYEFVADAYRRAARAVNTTPRELQATCWIVQRGVKPMDTDFHTAAAHN